MSGGFIHVWMKIESAWLTDKILSIFTCLYRFSRASLWTGRIATSFKKEKKNRKKKKGNKRKNENRNQNERKNGKKIKYHMRSPGELVLCCSWSQTPDSTPILLPRKCFCDPRVRKEKERHSVSLEYFEEKNPRIAWIQPDHKLLLLHAPQIPVTTTWSRSWVAKIALKRSKLFDSDPE